MLLPMYTDCPMPLPRVRLFKLVSALMINVLNYEPAGGHAFTHILVDIMSNAQADATLRSAPAFVLKTGCRRSLLTRPAWARERR